MESIALVLHGTTTAIHISGKDEMVCYDWLRINFRTKYSHYGWVGVHAHQSVRQSEKEFSVFFTLFLSMM